jgi:hypothetical protein
MAAFSVPFLAVVLILLYYSLLRGRYRLYRRLGRKPGFCPSAAALGMALQFLQVAYRPSVAYVVQAKLEEDEDEDDSGDPDKLNKHLGRQLRRIRRGEPVDRLILRI